MTFRLTADRDGEERHLTEVATLRDGAEYIQDQDAAHEARGEVWMEGWDIVATNEVGEMWLWAGDDWEAVP